MNYSIRTVRLLLCALVIGLVACGKSGENSEPEDVSVTLVAGIQTRAADNTWASGDQIGLTMLKAGTNDVLSEKKNCEYVTITGDGKFKPAQESQTIFYPRDGSIVDFLGYYPYSAGVTGFVTDLNVSNQSNLAAIDFMSSERFEGASKNKPNVQVRFKHRLTKIQFNLQLEDATKNLTVKKLEVRGMKTTGKYDFLNEKIEINASSEQNIAIPVANTTKLSTATGVVLPRAKGVGVVFAISLDDNTVYEVPMGDNLDLNAGTKYQFNILLRDKDAPAVVSAVIIEDWAEGATVNTANRPVVVIPDPGVTSGFAVGDKITLYHSTTELGTFTYDGTIWQSPSTLYWENIGDKNDANVTLRASYIRQQAANAQQMPEVMLAETTVARFGAVHLDFKLIPSKIEFQLKSEGGAGSTYSANELKNATIKLPGYVTEYTLKNGHFTKGAAKGDIVVVNGVALVVPQTVVKNIAVISIGGFDYPVTMAGNFQYKAGIVNKFVVNVTKTAMPSFSASFNDWETGQVIDKNALIVEQDGTTTNFKANDAMTLFVEENSAMKKLGKFVYDGSVWKTNPTIYWEELQPAAKYNFSAISILRDAPIGTNQMPDLMYASADDSPLYSFVTLAFKKKTARIIINLSSKDGSFDNATLQTAVITLPQYMTGGEFNSVAVYVPGTVRKDIAPNNTTKPLQWAALIEPQELEIGDVMIKIELGGNEYLAKVKGSKTIFKEAIAYTYDVNVEKASIGLTASYSEWAYEDSSTINTGLE